LLPLYYEYLFGQPRIRVQLAIFASNFSNLLPAVVSCFYWKDTNEDKRSHPQTFCTTLEHNTISVGFLLIAVWFKHTMPKCEEDV